MHKEIDTAETVDMDSVENKYYTKEQLDDLGKNVIPELKKKIDTLDSEERGLFLRLKRIKWNSLPMYCGEYSNLFICGSRSWESYKDELMDEWSGPRHKVMTSSKAGKLEFLALVVYLIAMTFIGITVFNSKGNWVCTIIRDFFLAFSALTYAMEQLLVGGVSVWYYLIRPNNINKKELERKLKEVQAHKTILAYDLELKEKIYERYTLGIVKPHTEFNQVKIKTVVELEKIVNSTINDVVPNINDGFKEKYLGILEKSKKLLEMAKLDGRMVTEISKIYMIFINEINSILLKSGEADYTSLVTLLDNFESYINRKIDKFSRVNKLVLDSDIDALNKALTEDLE